MLDNDIHKSVNNKKDWNLLTDYDKRLIRKKGRYKHALISGLIWNKNENMYFLTLTSADREHNIQKDWNYLLRMIRNDYGKIEFCKLETSEGNGVIHAVIVSPRLDVKWLRTIWDKRHNARQLRIDPVKKDNAKLVSYLLTQYLDKQTCYIRHNTSKNWIYPGYRDDFIYLVKKLGFNDAVALWDESMLLHQPAGQHAFDGEWILTKSEKQHARKVRPRPNTRKRRKERRKPLSWRKALTKTKSTMFRRRDGPRIGMHTETGNVSYTVSI